MIGQLAFHLDRSAGGHDHRADHGRDLGGGERRGAPAEDRAPAGGGSGRSRRRAAARRRAPARRDTARCGGTPGRDVDGCL